MKSCSVRLTSLAVRRGHPLLPAQIMHCYQLVHTLLPLLDNAHSTRLLGCFQHMPLFMIWAAATRTLLCSYLSSLTDLVIILESTFYVESTPFLLGYIPLHVCCPKTGLLTRHLQSISQWHLKRTIYLLSNNSSSLKPWLCYRINFKLINFMQWVQY